MLEISSFCTLCGQCLNVCPENALRLEGRTVLVSESCTLCGLCINSCPVSAISFRSKLADSKQFVNNVFSIMGELRKGLITNSTLELTSEASSWTRGTGSVIEVVFASDRIPENINILYAYGADSVVVLKNSYFSEIACMPRAGAFAGWYEQHRADVVLCSASTNGRKTAPMVAAALKTGLTADCTELSFDFSEGLLYQTRPAFGGNVMATILCKNHRPQMATVRPGIFRKELLNEKPHKQPVIEEISDSSLKVWQLSEVIHEIVSVSRNDVPLNEAKIIVSGGRGIGSRLGFERLAYLASLMNASLGASRSAVENKWIPQKNQIGQTGTIVSPDLYIAFGISGAIQHLAGIGGAKTIIAVNKDPNAPIHKASDYSVIGDLNAVVNNLIKIYENRKIS